MKQLGSIHKKGKLELRKYEISRTGSGKNDTVYNFFPKSKISKIPSAVLAEAEKLSVKKFFPIKSAKELAPIAKKKKRNTDED